MVGLGIVYKCKRCGLKQEHHVGGIRLYRVNGSDVEYTTLKCMYCSEVSFVCIGAEKANSEEEKNEVIEKKLEGVLGKNVDESIKERYRIKLEQGIKFINEDEYVILKKDVINIESVGVAMY